MKTYTATQLKNRTGDVLHDAQMNGEVAIQNRSRPDMVLMTVERYNQLMQGTHEIDSDRKYNDSVAELELNIQKRIDSGTIGEFLK